MKSAWIGIGFSHHKVPSLSKTATRSSAGTPADIVESAKSTIACLAAPSLQLASTPAMVGTRFCPRVNIAIVATANPAHVTRSG